MFSLVFENYVEMMHVDDQMIELSLWDTAGTACLLFRLSYTSTNVA